MSAGSVPARSPRTLLNAASCSAKDLVGLKNRNDLADINDFADLQWLTFIRGSFDP